MQVAISKLLSELGLPYQERCLQMGPHFALLFKYLTLVGIKLVRSWSCLNTWGWQSMNNSRWRICKRTPIFQTNTILLLTMSMVSVALKTLSTVQQRSQQLCQFSKDIMLPSLLMDKQGQERRLRWKDLSLKQIHLEESSRAVWKKFLLTFSLMCLITPSLW